MSWGKVGLGGMSLYKKYFISISDASLKKSFSGPRGTRQKKLQNLDSI
jgi:hypothetical protein